MLSNCNLWNDCQICHEILDTNNDAGALARFKLGEIFSPPTIVFGYVTIAFKVSNLSQLCENAHQCFLIEIDVDTKSFTVSHFIPHATGNLNHGLIAWQFNWHLSSSCLLSYIIPLSLILSPKSKYTIFS